MKTNLKNSPGFLDSIFYILFSKFCLVILLSTFYFLLSNATAQAATLYFSPSSGSYTVGQTFPVTVYVSSAEQAMNAASGVISFPQDKLEVASLSKSESIFNLWVQEPAFSNALGTINFEGIVLNPGFTGAVGKIISVNFRAKAAGNTTLAFSSGSVLANDGKGTNILTGLGSAVFGVNLAPSGPQAPETTTPSVIAGAPLAPVISSFTHPDPGKWYNINTAKFRWQAPDDVIAVRLLYDKNPSSQPRIVYEPPISEKEVQDLKDGSYYFHAQFKNKNGWGAITHFRFQIDTQPPESFTIKFVDGNETDNPRPTALFDTLDFLSGIDYYRVKIGEGDFFTVPPAAVIKGNPYTLPLQAPGKRTILVQVFDRANNYRVATEEFIIKPIKAPIISEYPEELTEGEILKIKGKTYPEAIVTIFFKSDLGKILSRETKADNQGNFTLIWQDQLKSGVYTFWAEATDSRGAKSEKSSIFTLIAKEKAFVKIGSLVINYGLAVISLLVVGFALFFLGWYLWYRFLLFKKRKRKQIKEAEQAVYSAFNLLRKSVREHLKLLEKTKNRREFTEAEDKIAKQLREDLDAAEKFVEKEIEDVEKEFK